MSASGLPTIGFDDTADPGRRPPSRTKSANAAANARLKESPSTQKMFLKSAKAPAARRLSRQPSLRKTASGRDLCKPFPNNHSAAKEFVPPRHEPLAQQRSLRKSVSERHLRPSIAHLLSSKEEPQAKNVHEVETPLKDKRSSFTARLRAEMLAKIPSSGNKLVRARMKSTKSSTQ
jgi:hypothetical protein